MVRQERLVNDAETTLDGAITDVATSITVIDGSVFPSEGDFRLIVDAEIMICTARATNVLTVVRGAEGTTAVAGSTGAAIIAIITQGGMDRYVKDFVDPAAFDRVPHRLLDDSQVVLTSTDFTWDNQGTSSVIDDPGGGMTIPLQTGTAPNFRLIHKSAPATPYTVTARIMTSLCENDPGDNINFIGFRDSSDGKLTMFSYQMFGNSRVQYALTSTDVTGIPAFIGNGNTAARADVWLKIEDDGTNLNYSKSADGVNWREEATTVRGTWFTTGPDQIIWGGDNQGDSGQMIHLLAWIEE